MTAQVPHILVVGGGYVGMYTAYGLRRAARKGRIRVTVVDPRSVKTHVSRILTKLDLNNRVQIALLVHDADLLH